MRVYACPKCGSTQGIEKEYIGGMDTGDRICSKCHFVGPLKAWAITEADLGLLVGDERVPDDSN